MGRCSGAPYFRHFDTLDSASQCHSAKRRVRAQLHYFKGKDETDPDKVQRMILLIAD